MSFYTTSPSNYPESFHVSPLQYKNPSGGSEGISMCMLIGVAAVVLYLMSSPARPGMYYGPHERSGRMVTSMVATLGDTLSAMKTAVVGESGLTVDASTVYPEIPPGVPLIDCQDASKDIMAFQTMQDSEKLQCHEKLLKWLAMHERAVLMVFAPWCPHCKQAMPLFHQLHQDVNVPFLMVNAEAFPKSTFLQAQNGKDPLIQCEYFPTFVAKVGTYVKIAPTLKAAAALATAEMDKDTQEETVEEALEGMIDDSTTLNYETLF